MSGLHFVRTGVFPQYIGKYYGQLLDERNTGDYEDFFDHDETSAKDLYAKAEEIITLITAKVNAWLAEQPQQTDNKYFFSNINLTDKKKPIQTTENQTDTTKQNI